ncbi:hypothetical protein BLW93_08535 [Desulfurobacterium indicum]|uniref:Aspartate racemase n=1 Tax=Desulfurobacterium indicum TaxID=1914305 RepID=A0A1R1MJF2_9BACT|nr:aspartate/glutamate racemase family protein [Desulfurobacterium indicum]OMH39830.1 hypothetical protein BLW93_08535 [Desulfurobacterium indicum]
MKTIGLLGGISWKSSIEYYRTINHLVNKKLGGVHSAKILMYFVDFAEIEKLQHQGQWEKATNFIIDAAKQIEMAALIFWLYAQTQCTKWQMMFRKQLAFSCFTLLMPQHSV